MGAIAKHYVELSARIDKLENAFKKVKKENNTLEKGFKKIGGAIAAAFAAEKLISFGIEASKLAAKAEGIQAAFDRLNQPTLLNELRGAVRGTVDDVTLMQSAVRAQNFKIPLEKLGSFFKFATDRAIQTGESVDYLTNSIIDGIGRKSTLVLDNLGISASELQAEMKKTGDFGLAAGNIIEREIAKAGDVADTTATKTARWGASMKNIQVTIGSGINKVLNMLAPAIDASFGFLVKMMPIVQKHLVAAINYFIDLYNESMLFRAGVQFIGVAFKNTWAFIKFFFVQLFDNLKNSAKAIKQLLTGDFAGAWETAKGAFGDVIDNYKTLGKDVADNYMKAIENTLTPKKKVELLTIDESMAAQAVESATAAGTTIANALLAPMASLGMGGGTEAGQKAPAGSLASSDKKNPVDQFAASFETLQVKAQESLGAAGGYISGFFEGFAGAFTSGENVMKQFLDYFKKWALQVIIQIAAIAAAAAVLSAITGGGFGAIFGNLFGGSGIGQAFGGMKDLIGMGGAAGGGGLTSILKGEDIFTSLFRFSTR
jgi:hypothetical protein